MRWVGITLLVTLSLLGVVGSTDSQETTDRLMLTAVPMFGIMDGETALLAGSTCPVDTNLVVTAGHVASAAERHTLVLRLPDGTDVPYRIVHIDLVHDLAFIQTDIDLPFYFPVAAIDAKPAFGDTAYTGLVIFDDSLGVSGGFLLGVGEGELQLSNPVSAGTSGACALTEDGRVFGIVLGARTYGPVDWDPAARTRTTRVAPLLEAK